MIFSTGFTLRQQKGSLLGKDSHLTTTAFAFMQVTATVDGEEQVILENPLVNSSWSCRPLRLHFARETTGKLLYSSVNTLFEIFIPKIQL